MAAKSGPFSVDLELVRLSPDAPPMRWDQHSSVTAPRGCLWRLLPYETAVGGHEGIHAVLTHLQSASHPSQTNSHPPFTSPPPGDILTCLPPSRISTSNIYNLSSLPSKPKK